MRITAKSILDAQFPSIDRSRVQKIGIGLSDSSVYLLPTLPKTILKIQKGRREYEFYVNFVPKYMSTYNWIPTVIDSGIFCEVNWLQLEYVEEQWSREYWDCDTRALTILSNLHAIKPSQDDFQWNHCTWDRTDIEILVKPNLPNSSIETLLEVHRLFEIYKGTNTTLCSGDPFPLNWRVRGENQLVLTDWQSLCLENPAFDLAGWISTTISVEKIKYIADEYQRIAEYTESENLPKEIFVFLCRRWCNNFINAKKSHFPDQWENAVVSLRKDLPSWLETASNTLM